MKENKIVLNVKVLFDGVIFLVNENDKVLNMETNGYIRKAEKVNPILDMANKIRNERKEYQERKNKNIKRREKERKERREATKKERQEQRESEHESESKKQYLVNDTIRSQIVYEFLVLDKDVSELEKELKVNVSDVLTSLNLNHSHKGNFLYCKPKTVLSTLKRYGRNNLVKLLNHKYRQKQTVDTYGIRIS